MSKTKQHKTKSARSISTAKPASLSPRWERTLLISIILLALAVRLLFLFAPLLDFHSQRQTQTADTARNFYQYDMNFFQPRFMIVDINGDAPAITGMEFPLYQYILAIFYQIFGAHDFFGRLLSILFGLGTLWFTYLLGKKYIGVSGGLFAALAYAINPVAVFFNRTYQPDTAALFFFAGGLYYLLVWFDEKTRRALVLASAATALSLLIKPPALAIIAPIVAYKVYEQKLWMTGLRPHLWRGIAFAALAVGVCLLWYYYAYDIIFSQTGAIIRRGAYPGEHVRTWEFWLSPRFYSVLLERFMILLTLPGVVLYALGLYLSALEKKSRFLVAGFIGYLLYFIGFAEYNVPHYYYQLPFIPLAATTIAVAAPKALDWIKKDKTAQVFGPTLIAGSMIALAVFGYTTAAPWYNQSLFILDAAEGIKKVVPAGSIVRSNTPAFSDLYYYTNTFRPHIIYDKQLAGPRYIRTLREDIKMGTEYAIWLKYEQLDVSDYNNNGRLIAETPLYAIWKLNKD